MTNEWRLSGLVPANTGTHGGHAPLQSSLPFHLQGVVYQPYGDVGQVEAVEDVIVEHDRLQVVEADEVNELVDAL